ncbi:MAG: hypothetical protein K2X50_01755 [Gammaproteobacteria bacterium]|nr:hypothetical protein [Gammaproteobacteria bacterium]
MEDRKETNHFVRAILFGDETSEKSNILRCIKNQKPASVVASSSEDRIQYNVQFRENRSVKLDLLNHKQDRTHSSYPLRGIQIIIVVFSYKDLSSLNNLKSWINEVDRFSRENIPKIIIGNCFSHNDTIVQEEDVKKIIEDLSCPFARVKENDIESVQNALFLALDQLPSLQNKAPLELTQTQADPNDEHPHRFNCTML